MQHEFVNKLAWRLANKSVNSLNINFVCSDVFAVFFWNTKQ